MNSDQLFHRYQELQAWIGWTSEDAQRIQSLAPVLESGLSDLVEDFYQEIQRHPAASRVITGGKEQIERLKLTLRGWLHDLLSGNYNREYVDKRWRVGYRHVEIGLEQTYANAALARLRRLLLEQMKRAWPDDPEKVIAVSRSLSMLLDLDLAIIGDAYYTEQMQRLQRTERLATIGQVAGGIAHEMRNPLNVIQTSLYYLQNARNPTPEKVREHLNRMERRVTAADQVITALSRFTKMGAPKLEPFDLAACAQEALRDANVPADVEVQVDLSGAREARARGDREQVYLVLSNLIRNACEAMPGGGRLTLRFLSSEESISIEVEDSGCGIEIERLSQVMEPLFSTKARGLGLGLAISKAVIDRHQGELSVVSELGKGTTFTVRLPSANESSKVVDVEPDPNTHSAGRR